MIVGLGHRSRHGKDTVANMMIEWASYMRPDLRVRKLSWAWKLKDVAHQLYGHLGLREPEFYDTPEGAALRDVQLPGIAKTPVEVWIDLGTPAVRECVWNLTWIAWVKAQQADCDVLIVPDTRFPEEVDACDRLVKVVDPRKPDRPGKSVDHLLANYEGWDHTIINDMGLSELRGQANTVATKLLGDFKLP